ncbi:unnamed protein product, partial [Allacma fusca]
MAHKYSSRHIRRLAAQSAEECRVAVFDFALNQNSPNEVFSDYVPSVEGSFSDNINELELTHDQCSLERKNPEKEQESEACHSYNFRSALQKWAVEENITHKSLSKLLNLSRGGIKECEYLPKDSRTFLQTSRSTEVRKVQPGYYFHFGILKGLQKSVGSISVIPDPIEMD